MEVTRTSLTGIIYHCAACHLIPIDLHLGTVKDIIFVLVGIFIEESALVLFELVWHLKADSLLSVEQLVLRARINVLLLVCQRKHRVRNKFQIQNAF